MLGRLHRRDVQVIVVLAVIAIALMGIKWYGFQMAERAFQNHNATEETVR